jgi:hypothetical protein
VCTVCIIPDHAGRGTFSNQEHFQRTVPEVASSSCLLGNFLYVTNVRPLHSDLHKYIPSLPMAATSPALVHIRDTGLNVFKSTWSHCCSYPHSRKGIEAIQSGYIMVDVVCNILHKASRSTARYICSLRCCSVCFTSEYEEEYPC